MGRRTALGPGWLWGRWPTGRNAGEQLLTLQEVKHGRAETTPTCPERRLRVPKPASDAGRTLLQLFGFFMACQAQAGTPV